MKPTNCHIHLPPNFSAFESVEDALDSAASEQIRLLGTSNYYDFEVYERFSAGAKERGIYPLLGLEIVTWIDDLAKAGTKVNDPGNPGKAYLCGKAIATYDNPTVGACQLLERIRVGDEARIRQMCERLNEILTIAGVPTVLTPNGICAEIAVRYDVSVESVVLQERHLAQAYQQHIFQHVPAHQIDETLERILHGNPKGFDALTVQADIRTHLMKAGKPAYVAESFISFEEGTELILELGGVPSYPVLADGADPICGFESDPRRLLVNLRRHGIHAAEFIPNRNRASVLRDYVLTLRDAGIVVTAGTEHNTQDKVAMLPKCSDGPVPDDLMEIFWSGACVLAAHQTRVGRGDSGLVDDHGRLVGKVEELRAEGEAILA